MENKDKLILALDTSDLKEIEVSAPNNSVVSILTSYEPFWSILISSGLIPT